MVRNCKIIQFDIHKLDYTPEGLPSYFWPVSDKEREYFGDKFMEGYMALLRADPMDEASKAPYKLLFKYIFNEMIAVFWGDLLRERFAASGADVDIPSHNYRFWPSLFAKRTPPDRHVFLFQTRFRKKPSGSRFTLSRIRRAFSLLRLSRRGVEVGRLKVRPISEAVLRDNIIATQRSALIDRHAAVVGEDVVFCRSERWFHEITDSERDEAAGRGNRDFEANVFALIARLYEQSGISFEDHSRAFLEKLLIEGAACLRVHYERLVERPDRLPRRVWTGSGGNTWDKALSLAVHQAGGESTGHDHGAGLGHVDRGMIAVNELWGCDQFYTFTEGQRDALRRYAVRWPSMESVKPEIHCPQDGFRCPVRDLSRFRGPMPAVRTVMIPWEVYDGDRGRVGPYSADITYVDWQARLLARLSEWGYQAIMKVHPESPTLPPEQFQTKFGARLESRRFGEVLENADLVLMDHLYTTVFQEVLATDKPLVLIDNYQHPWTDEGLELFKKRASYVVGGFDADNRAQVNWDELKKAIEDAPTKRKDESFFRCYYG